MKLDLATHGGSLFTNLNVLPGKFSEQPTQRLMISHSIETEAKKAHKPGERDHHAVLHGCGLVALA